MDSDCLTAEEISAVEFINEHLTDDLESFSNARPLYDEVQRAYDATKRRLEQQLACVTTEAPCQIEKSLKDIANATLVINKFAADEDQLVSDIQNCLADVSPLVRKLSTLTKQIQELKKYSRYLSCIAHVEDLSSDIQSAILINAVERAVDQFNAMVAFARAMKDSNCQHLVNFVKKTVTFWYRILQDKLCGEFDECLKAWQWPFITVTVKAPPAPPKANELRENLGVALHHLVCLQSPNDLLVEKVTSPFSIPMSDGSPTLLLPIQMLLKPFQKRFVYHFCANEKTNRPDKPEWYFTQILSWIQDHQDFIKTRIQPEFDKAELRHVSALVEFIRGLVALVMWKMSRDVDQGITDNLLAHLIDETLSFHRELRTRYGYPDAFPGCLHVLVQKELFCRWIAIEKKYALEKMDTMLSSSTRWQCQYKSITDSVDSKVSECGESFMTLIITITDRYKLLPSISHQLQFAQLQLELLDDFRVRLIQIKTELLNTSLMSPLCQDHCSILNTVAFIIELMQSWNNNPFFVKLQYYNQRSRRSSGMFEASLSVSTFGDRLGSGSDVTERNDPHGFLAEVEVPDPSLEDNDDLMNSLNVSLFDEVVNLYKLLQDSMLVAIESYVVDDVKARSRPYRHERWLALPSQKEFLSLALSNSACELLRVLKDHLHLMELQLSPSLFSLFWQQLAASLNDFIYKEVIRHNNFNEGGAAQLQFDMTRNLFPLFGAYTAKPENFFKDIKESCLILTLTAGSAMLLRDVLNISLHQSHSKAAPSDPVAALHDIGVYKLDLDEVEYLLSRRVDLGT